MIKETDYQKLSKETDTTLPEWAFIGKKYFRRFKGKEIALTEEKLW